jgi:putative ABC transport system permease protein
MDQLGQDLRLAFRQLVKQRGFAAIVVMTLGLAIGVNAVVFSFINFFVFRPLPLPDPSRVVLVFATHPERAGDRQGVAYGDFLEWSEQTRTLDDLAAFTRRTRNLTGTGEPLRVQDEATTASLFRAWGLAPRQGRVIQPEDDRPGAPRVALLSHGFWARHFGSDPAVVGRTLRLDGEPHVVIGVLDPAIEIGTFSEVDIWTPLAPTADPSDRENRSLRVTGRLKPGVELPQAAAEIQRQAERQERDHRATNVGWGARVVPFRKGMSSASSWVVLTLLAVAVGLVLAVACANVANLMLARGAARQRETALRAALGANRGRLVRQLLTEGLVLSLGGGVLGVVLAAWGLDVIRSVTFEPFFQLVVVDRRVVVFCAGLVLLAPLLFGLLPALQATRLDLVTFLKEAAGGAVGASRGRVRLRGSLVSGQLALAITLLIVAGLSVRTAVALRRLDLGFDHHGLLTLSTELPAGRYASDESVQAFAAELEKALLAAPGVRGVAAGTARPLLDRVKTTLVVIEGAEPPRNEALPWAAREVVSTDYFRTLGLVLTKGRAFTSADVPGAERVAVVNQALASRYLPGTDPLGKRIRLGDSDSPWLTIVGLSANVINEDTGSPPRPQVYLPLLQQPSRALTFFVRGEPLSPIVDAARREVARLDPDQPLYDVKTMERAFFEALAGDRVVTGLFAVFALVALTLATVGLYGLISYAVSQRAREIGVRVALGARRSDVLRLVMGQGGRLVLLGLVVGVALGFAMARVMASELLAVGISPHDPVTFAIVPGVLVLVSVLATFVPARRAARLDPASVLRSE